MVPHPQTLAEDVMRDRCFSQDGKSSLHPHTGEFFPQALPLHGETARTCNPDEKMGVPEKEAYCMADKLDFKKEYKDL